MPSERKEKKECKQKHGIDVGLYLQSRIAMSLNYLLGYRSTNFSEDQIMLKLTSAKIFRAIPICLLASQSPEIQRFLLSGHNARPVIMRYAAPGKELRQRPLVNLIRVCHEFFQQGSDASLLNNGAVVQTASSVNKTFTLCEDITKISFSRNLGP